MRLGQTSVTYFLSNLLASFLGFLGTLYIARLLGAEPLGIYYLSVAMVSWLAVAGRVGVSQAIAKRISEGDDQGPYALAGLSIIVLLFLIIFIGLIISKPTINEYIGYSATGYIIVMIFIVLAFTFINSFLTGLHKVHITGFLSPLNIGGRATLQILLIVIGWSTAALFLGHIFGLLLVVIIGLIFIFRDSPNLSLPRKHHFQDLIEYAKFSWIGSLQARMFSYTDILILGFFVSSGLIGIYSVAWNISQFLMLFSVALKSTLFPEMSELSAKHDPQAVSQIVEKSLSFGGLFLIPGVYGGALLSGRILRIYGTEFIVGGEVLIILIIANLFMGYQNQLLNTLNAIDRPDLAFRVNAVFIVANLILNIILVYAYGWIGAAFATALSTGISLILAYFHVRRIISFKFPTSEIAKQWLSATFMAIFVYIGLYLENTFGLLGHNVATVIILVTLGASIYFLVLINISVEFRRTVDRNIPMEFPFIHS